MIDSTSYRATVALVAVMLVVCRGGPATPTVYAQEAVAAVRGRVVDGQGGVLPGVAVVARSQESGLFRESTTGPDGVFVLNSMMPGLYRVEADLPGFRKYQRADLRLEVGRTATLDITLEVAGVGEEVIVTAEAPIVDATSKEVGGFISNQELANLPSLNRNFTGYLALLPGAVPNFATDSFGADSVVIGGQSSSNVNFTFDGSSNNDTFIGGQSGAQARIPIEAIQEFQLLTGQFDAEFGGTSGGIVNAVSKQGTNQYRGSAFYFIKDSAMTAKDHFAKAQNLEKPDTRELQFGGTAGGPIARDKAHFFFSLERVVLDRGITLSIPARPELSSSESIQTRVWNYFARADHQINGNHTWGVRWLRELSPQHNLLQPNRTKAAAEAEQDDDQTYVGTLSSVLGSTTVNQFKVAHTREHVFNASDPFFENGNSFDGLSPTLERQTFRDQQSPRADDRTDHAYVVNDTFSWYVPNQWGSHDLKAGVEFIHQEFKNNFLSQLNGSFLFSGDAAFNAADPRTYPDQLQIRVPGSRYFVAKMQRYSSFLQDKWRPNPHLTLSLGLRYELELLPIDESWNPAFSNAGDYPVDKNNFSPRVGFSYGWDQGASVLRGGWGLFFQRSILNDISGLWTGRVYGDSFVVSFPANNRDPGPSAGRLPSDPMLVNGPTVNRVLLDSLYPQGALLKNAGVVTVDNPDRRQPYSHQVSVGLQRQLWPNTALSVDYIGTFSRAQLLQNDLNPGLRADTTRTGRVTRVDPSFVTSVFQITNLGLMDYHALQLQLEKRFSRSYSVRASYTLAEGQGNIATNRNPSINFQLLDDLRLDLNQGPSDVDRRHNLALSGTMDIPRTGGLRVSTIARLLSGAPFSIIDTSTDPDRNGILFDPLPEGTYSGSGADALTVDNVGGRNGAYGPSYFQLDARFGYRFRFGERTLESFGEVLNLTNRTNFANPSGDRRAATFLVPTGLSGGGPTRTLQLGVRATF